MRYLLRKLGFIHGRLWRQDETYRTALLVGPAPAFGVALALAIWSAIAGVRNLTAHPPPWANMPAPREWATTAEQPKPIQPSRTLPQLSSNGQLVGYEPGWNVGAHPAEVDRTMAVDVKPNAVTAFTILGPVIDLDEIIALGPKRDFFVAVGTGFFVVRQAGIYALSARLDRPGGPPVNCLTRLSFGPNRITSHITLNVGSLSTNYDTAWFDVQPGLYTMGWAFGCWHDNALVGPAHMTILIGRPGDNTLQPARADDFVR
jgi:hypothetical protein